MKKTYITPEVNLFRIEPQQMVAGSNDTIAITTEETTEVESRRHYFDIWGDEEE